MMRANQKTKPAAKRTQRRIRCAIYVRSAVGGEATTRQRAECLAYVRARSAAGWSLVGAPYEDVGASGMDLDRPGLVRLIRDAESGCFDRVLAVDVARLTRDLRLLGEVARRLGRPGIDVVAVGEERVDLGALCGRVAG